MKKIVLLFFATSLSISCSSSDDSGGLSNDSIVGKWQLTHQKVGSLTINQTSCHQQSFIEYKSDLTASRENYVPTQSSNCILQFSGNGTWKKVGANIYKFTDNQTGISAEEEIIFIDDTHMFIDYSSIEFYFEKQN